MSTIPRVFYPHAVHSIFSNETPSELTNTGLLQLVYYRFATWHQNFHINAIHYTLQYGPAQWPYSSLYIQHAQIMIHKNYTDKLDKLTSEIVV